MTDEQPEGKHVRSYAEIATDAALPGGYAVIAALFSIFALFNLSFVVHAHAVPFYTGDTAATIAREPTPLYVGNVVVWGSLALYAAMGYVRWNDA